MKQQTSNFHDISEFFFPFILLYLIYNDYCNDFDRNDYYLLLSQGGPIEFIQCCCVTRATTNVRTLPSGEN